MSEEEGIIKQGGGEPSATSATSADPHARFLRFLNRRRTTFTLPTADDVRALDELAQSTAVLVWRRRHANEQASVDLAERMHALARVVGLERTEPGVVRSLERLAEDERSHASVAKSVVILLGASQSSPQPLRSPVGQEAPALSFARDVLVGLVLCESVSAARFSVVRTATDIPVFRRLIDAFLRDEIAHASLGFQLLAAARSLVENVLGVPRATRWIHDELMKALNELELVVGLDGARKGLLPRRAQPPNNPGVVEPNMDAIAFYDAINRRVLPRLEKHGIALKQRWDARLADAS